MAKLHRNVWVASAASFLTDVSSEMLWNVLPLFLQNVLGVRMAAIGLIEGVAEALSSLLKVVSGYVSDLSAKRKPLAVVGYAISTAAKPFLLLVASWGGVLAVRVTDRVGKGLRTAPRDALVAASVRERDRGFAFGLHRAADTAGAFVGIAVAAATVWLVQRQNAGLEAQTFRLLVLGSLVPAALAVVVLLVGLKDVEAPPAGGGRPRVTLSRIDGRLKGFFVAVFVFTLGNSADAFIVLRAQERGLSVLEILLMITAFNAVYALVSTPAGRWSDAIGRRRVLATGWLLYAGVYLGFALARTTTEVVGLYLIYGLYHGLTDGVARALVADLVAGDQRGTAFGLYHAVVGIAALPASFGAGLLWQHLSPAAPFYAGAALAVIATVLLGVLSSSRERRPTTG